jgi:hypothetical protein
MQKIFNEKTRELWVGIVVFVIAAAYLFGTMLIKHSDIVSVGAEFMPKIYGGFMLVLSILQIISGYRKMKKSDTKTPEEKPEEKSAEKAGFWRSARPILITFGLIIFGVAIMRLVGFVISSAIMMFGMCVLLTPGYSKKRYVLFALFSILVPLAAYFLFKNVLYVSLPIGIFF